MHTPNSTIRHLDFSSDEELARVAKVVQEKMLQQGMPVPAISQVMLGLTRGFYQEYLRDDDGKAPQG